MSECAKCNKYLQNSSLPIPASHIPFPSYPCPFSLPFSVPCLIVSSLASKNLWFLTACVALDETAPVELAVALPDSRVVVCVVTPTTTHHVTAVCEARGAVAQSSSCPCASCGPVLFAIVGRALQVHQVCVCGLLVASSLFETQEGGLAKPRGSNWLYLNCIAVAFLQQVTDLSEIWQGDPTGLSSTGTRYTMTLAL